MPGRAEQLFEGLKDSAAILALIGSHEDGYLDCKEWHPRDTSPEKWLAKVICGLSNAGGVLVIGMKAPSKPKDEADIIESAIPVADTALVKSRVLDLVGKNVEPGIVGIDVREVPDGVSPSSGFVVVFVPASEGRPRRSRVDWKFYQRIGSITLPMEYFQIEERFGVRPHPRLELFLEHKDYQGNIMTPRTPGRQLVIGLHNSGAGIAKFPSIWFARSAGLAVSMYGIDGNMRFGLDLAPTEGELIAFRGGVNDVIYPDQTLKIAILVQQGENVGVKGISRQEYPMLIPGSSETHHRWVFKPVALECHISCEGMQTKRVEGVIPEGSAIVPNNY